MLYDLISKYFDIFVEKLRAMQKLLTFFDKKYWRILDIKVSIFNKTLTNEFVSFEQSGSTQGHALGSG